MKPPPLRHLGPTLAVVALAILGCMLPPTTMGLRSAGDLAEQGTTTVGGGAAALSGGLSGGAVDLEHSVADNVALGASVGHFGVPMVQTDVRVSTAADQPLGLGGVAGLGVMANSWFAIGPYVGAVARAQVGDAGHAYAGGKINHVFPTDALSVQTTWLSPSVGFCSKQAPVRWGVEGVGQFAQTSTGNVKAGGVQGYVKVALGRRDKGAAQ